MSATPITVWTELQQLADAACEHFKLHMARLEPIVSPRLRCFGDCDFDAASPSIRLRVHQLNRPSQPLARQTIIDTLAHELAHLAHSRHGRKHLAMRRDILTFWKENQWI